VYVARADVFSQPKFIKFLTLSKILPINRRRDGIESLSKNEEINHIAVDVLHDKVPFCIFPEGTHRTMHSLMPLQKGLFRIALQANEKFGNKMPLYIIPVGIEFGHFFRYRSSLLVQIGDPINVTQFVDDHFNFSVPQQINALRDELSDRLKKVILHIPDDNNYTATLELSQLYCKEQRQRLKLSENTLINRFTACKETIQNVASFIKSNRSETQKILDMADVFSRQRHTLGIGLASMLRSHFILSLIGKISLLLLGLPYFIFSTVVTSPITLLSVWLCSKFRDKAFHNAVRFLAVVVLFPVLLLATGITTFVLFPWKWGVLFTLLFIPSHLFLHEYLRLARLFISDLKWLIHSNLRILFKEINIYQTRLTI